MILYTLILLPLITGLVVAMSPEGRAKSVALAGSLLSLAATLVAVGQFDWARTDQFQFVSSALPLVPPLNINLTVGVDSIALWLIVLTSFLQPLCVLGSFTAITERRKTYYAWLTVLQAAMTGVFASRDVVFFYICFEFTLLPMYVLISLYGSTNRRKAATKFFLYTFTGSIIALAGIVYVAWKASAGGADWTFDIDALTGAARTMSPREQALVLGALMAGFAVKVPLFPLHTWLPLAHTEAPTAGSVVLAGVLLKLGTFAILRFVLPMVPLAVVEYTPLIAIVSVVGILYGGLICWVQRDVKKLVAYSSVSHRGFCVLGMFALNSIGLGGSVLYMINHGLSTGALFFCIGFMYERYHTRSLDEVGGLLNKMPVWSFFMVFFTLASVGLPGLNGFVSEFMCLLGTFQSGAQGVGGTPGRLGPVYAAIAGTGMIVGAIYLLFMLGKIVFGELREPVGHHHHDSLPVDLGPREIGVLVPLAVACIVLGVLPTPMLRTLEKPLDRVVAVYRTGNLLGSGPSSAPVAQADPDVMRTSVEEAAP